MGLADDDRASFAAAARGGAAQLAVTWHATAYDAVPPTSVVRRESPALPSGTVTFLFTDIEGSTRLLQHLGVARYAEALKTVRRLLRAACAQHQGLEVDATGDGSFFAFAQAPVMPCADMSHPMASHSATGLPLLEAGLLSLTVLPKNISSSAVLRPTWPSVAPSIPNL